MICTDPSTGLFSRPGVVCERLAQGWSWGASHPYHPTEIASTLSVLDRATVDCGQGGTAESEIGSQARTAPSRTICEAVRASREQRPSPMQTQSKAALDVLAAFCGEGKLRSLIRGYKYRSTAIKAVMTAVGWSRVDRTGRVNDDPNVEMLWLRRLSAPHPSSLNSLAQRLGHW
jgi:hypothetical protein